MNANGFSKRLSGSLVSMVTPFTETFEVDEAALRRLIQWHVDVGAEGMILCGSTGEDPTLDHDEFLRIVKMGVEMVKGKFPLIVGTGSNSTRETVRRTRIAKECGADACLVIVPYYNRPMPEGCLAHFREVAKVGLPMIVYHHPGRTGVKLSTKMLAQIAAIDEVVAIKETCGDVDFATELVQAVSVPILSGDDTIVFPMMAVGGVGVISIVANLIPTEWKALMHQCRSGNLQEAQALFTRYYPLCKALVMETNPQCVKYALSLMGKCQAHMRLPLLEPQEHTKKHIEAAMRAVNLIP